MDVLILGAGPAGLTLANRLKQCGRDSFLVLEAEAEAGGLCRSVMRDGAPLDIGGGHFLDVRRPLVNRFLFGFMPASEWRRYVRDSRIRIGGRLITHPLEANIWQLDLEDQVAYLRSVACAGCNTGAPMPGKFVEWITWKLGERIAEDYMLPYNRKMFGEDLNDLGTYWLEKLPDVSFEDTLRSCLMHRAYGKQPGHAEFYYPEAHGFGELWRRMADALGDHIEYGKRVDTIDLKARSVTTADGSIYRAERIVTTIPWRSVTTKGLPAGLQEDIRELRHTSIVINPIPDSPETQAHWIYVPDPAVDHHRILVRKNFCPGASGCWTETRLERFHGDLDRAYLNEYAYPLNTLNKPAVMRRLLAAAGEMGVYGLGRWGEHEHYNADLVVEKALAMAEGMT